VFVALYVSLTLYFPEILRIFRVNFVYMMYLKFEADIIVWLDIMLIRNFYQFWGRVILIIINKHGFTS
jgi:hypothetical protein